MCSVAHVPGPDPRLTATVALVANLNTQLDHALDELAQTQTQLKRERQQIEELRVRLGEQADHPPQRRASSPPRKRFRYGSSRACTKIVYPAVIRVTRDLLCNRNYH